MTLHLLKLVWNRKRANALIVTEILASFLVLFAVLAASVNFAMRWRAPLGFDWHDVWRIHADIELESDPENNPKVHETMMRVMREIATMPEVVSAAADNTPPYAFSHETTGTKVNGHYVQLTADNVTDDFARVMHIDVERGRWFSAEDDSDPYRPTVINEKAAMAIFGTTDVVGRKITFPSSEGGSMESDAPLLVVGVIKDYRKDGEPTESLNFIFRRVAPDHKFGGLVRDFLVRVRPGTPPEFEEQLIKRMQATAPDMTFRSERLESTRRDALRFRLAPAILGAIVAAFLISMVSLGLTGVLWQNVTRRTREIGLRRAIGATGGRVHQQILGEVALLATIAVAIGLIIVLQLPIVGAFKVVTKAAFATGIGVAVAMIYALAILCGLYPSWLASRLQPADALRYE